LRRDAGKEENMKPKIFIDGKEGTTGLQIFERLGGRADIELLTLPGNFVKMRKQERR